MKRRFRKGCKPNSVPLLNGENHLSAQPIPETRPAFAGLGAGRSGVSYLALHPMGFSVPRRLRFARCALTAPFHHHRRFAPAAVYFLWHCPSRVLSPARVYRLEFHVKTLRGIAPFGVRTFLFQLTREAILRPSKTTCMILSRL
jgi:hypothetical protein